MVHDIYIWNGLKRIVRMIFLLVISLIKFYCINLPQLILKFVHLAARFLIFVSLIIHRWIISNFTLLYRWNFDELSYEERFIEEYKQIDMKLFKIIIWFDLYSFNKVSIRNDRATHNGWTTSKQFLQNCD